MNEQGEIKEFPTDEKAKEEGFKFPISEEEKAFLEQFPEAERLEQLHAYRAVKRESNMKRHIVMSKKTHHDPKHTKKLFQRPTGNKKKMIKQAKKRNRK